MRKRIVEITISLSLVVTLLVPAVAFAGASTDAALGLGAFAVFNQMLGGVGIFAPAHPAVVVAPPPVVVAPPPPPPVIVYPYTYPTYYYPAPVYYYPRYYYAVPRRCPPGLAKQGRC
jgi:hypothetical protein